jgi:rod shape-determining protein MreC
LSLDKNGASKFYVRKPFLKQVNSTFHAYRQLILFLFLCIVTIFILVISVSNSLFAQRARLFLMEAMHPIAKLGNAPSEGLRDAKGRVEDWIFAYEELQRTRQENKALKNREAYYKTLKNENTELRKILHVVKSNYRQLKTVPVISYPGKPFIRSILLEAGQRQGIESQKPLVTIDGLVGRTIESSPNLTRGILITDLNSRIPVIIKPSNHHAILVGDNTDTPILKYLPYNAEIKKGEIVETSGKGGLFPAGIPVGTIESVSRTDAKVKPYVALDSLSFVHVLSYELGEFSSRLK